MAILYLMQLVHPSIANRTMKIVLSNNTIIYRCYSEDTKTMLTKESYMANCYKEKSNKGYSSVTYNR